MKKDCSKCLLTRYFDIKLLTPDIRYIALKQWEEEAKQKIKQQENSIIELSLVVGSRC